MAALLVSIVANIKGEDIPWENVPPDLKQKISTKLHNDAMNVAGYSNKVPTMKRNYKLQA